MTQTGKTRVQFEFDILTMNRLKKLKHKTEASSYAAVVRDLVRVAATHETPNRYLPAVQGLAMSGRQLYSLYEEKMEREGTTITPWTSLTPDSIGAWKALALEVVLRIP